MIASARRTTVRRADCYVKKRNQYQSSHPFAVQKRGKIFCLLSDWIAHSPLFLVTDDLLQYSFQISLLLQAFFDFRNNFCRLLHVLFVKCKRGIAGHADNFSVFQGNFNETIFSRSTLGRLLIRISLNSENFTFYFRSTLTDEMPLFSSKTNPK